MRRVALIERKRVSPAMFHLILGGLIILEVVLLSIVRWIVS
ncbi:MAG TPA: hypothetical protein VFQ70_02420 [Candidatus Saccharimonadaceae bacterium]|nr:hypothetical protein [Candidatus Saccharimonadaceae bacterium]